MPASPCCPPGADKVRELVRAATLQPPLLSSVTAAAAAALTGELSAWSPPTSTVNWWEPAVSVPEQTSDI
jgi:hypothetical protein